MNDPRPRKRWWLTAPSLIRSNAFVLALSAAGPPACSLRSLDHLHETEGARTENAGAGGTHASGGTNARGGSLGTGELTAGRRGALGGKAGMGGVGGTDGGGPAGSAGSGGAGNGGSTPAGDGGANATGGSGAAGGNGAETGGGAGGASGSAGSPPGGAGGGAGMTSTGCVQGDPCPLQDETAYQLVPGHNPAACIDVLARSFNDGARAIQYENFHQSNQVMWAEARGNGTFSFRNANSGKCLEVSEGSLEADAPVRQWTCTGEAHQRWRPVPASDGLYRLVAEHSGLVLDVDGPNSEDNGVSIVQNPERDLADTMWQLREAAEAAFVAIRASGSTTARVRHAGASVSFVATSGNDAEWKVARGLADAACVSFEARDQPGYFLRHVGGVVSCEQREDNEDFSRSATFCLRAPLQDLGWSYRSIQPLDTPDTYLLRDGDRVVAGSLEATEAFHAAATWFIQEPPAVQ